VRAAEQRLAGRRAAGGARLKPDVRQHGELSMRLRRGIVAILASCTSLTCIAAEPLYVARARDHGASFDLILSETKREPSRSMLSVPGFHSRTAAGSRWLMCMYNDLAAKRGFAYWTVIYPEEPVEVFPIALYQTESEDVGKLLGRSYVAARAFPPKPTSVAMWNQKVCRRDK